MPSPWRGTTAKEAAADFVLALLARPRHHRHNLEHPNGDPQVAGGAE
jgi:hypothetical protein